MLSLIVLVFVLIDLIILITYNITVGVAYRADNELGAEKIINAKDPEDIEGVSKKCTIIIPAIIKGAISYQ